MHTRHPWFRTCTLALLLVAPGMALRAAEGNRSDKGAAAAPPASLLENCSFEEGDAFPRHWKPSTLKNGKTEWVNGEFSSGHRAVKMVVADKADAAEWAYGEIKGFKPDTPYTISAQSKGNGKAGFFRLRFYTGGKVHLVALSCAAEWRKTTYTFNSGGGGGCLVVEHCNWQGTGPAEVYVDDVVLTEGLADAATPLTRKEIACLTDDTAGTTILSLCALYPGRLRVADLGAVNWDDVASFEKIVVLPRQASAITTDTSRRLRNLAESGKPVVLDLAAYAALNNTSIETKTLPRLTPMADFEKKDKAQQTPDARRNAAKAEEEVPIPLAVVVADADLSAGFPVGSEVPWFGHAGDRFVQHVLPDAAVPVGTQVVAKSNLGGAVWLRQPVGKGTLCAVDISSLDEMTMQWSERGSYNKYVPLQNALGHGLRYGTYWNRRATYADYIERFKAMVRKYPALTLTVEGYANGYNRFGACVGNPKGPIHVFGGMSHAREEYRSGMYGLYCFAEFLGKHADESPWKERLQKIGVKIIPVVNPELYCAGTADRIREFQGKEGQLPCSNWAGAEDNIRAAIQQHHGVGPLMVGFGVSFQRGLPWAKAIHKCATEQLYDIAPTVYWDLSDPANTGPQPINRVSTACHNPPSWDGYFNQSHYPGFANVKETRVKQARLNVLAEHTIFGVDPVSWRSACQGEVPFDVPARETQSALMADQAVTFLLATVLVEEPAPEPDAK